MPIDRIMIYGAGGHAAVTLDALLLARPDTVIKVIDDDTKNTGKEIIGFQIEAATLSVIRETKAFHVAIGDNRARARVFTDLVKRGGSALSIVHPAAIVSKFALLEPGCFVGAHAVVAPRAKIGKGSIINHAAVVDHDCIVGAFCHIAPTASLGGGVKLGNQVLVGAGANILPGLIIGNSARIGAGAVVVEDVAHETLVVGVPAQEKRKD